jgi:hypothetical protein
MIIIPQEGECMGRDLDGIERIFRSLRHESLQFMLLQLIQQRGDHGKRKR